jgi:hypothetical protein
MSKLATTRKLEGRVDVLALRLIEAALKRSKHSELPVLYAGAKPAIEALLRQHVGPRTKRGRQIADNLFAIREAWERMQQHARKGQRV